MPAFVITKTVTGGLLLPNPSLGNPVTLTATADVSNDAGHGLTLAGGLYTVQVDGTVSTSAPEFNALILSESGISKLSKINIGIDGRILGESVGLNSYGLAVLHSANITNAGHIAGINAIRVDGSKTAYTIKNTGHIESLNYFDGDGRELSRLALEIKGVGKHTVINSGLIEGTIHTFNGTTNIINSGQILGSVDNIENEIYLRAIKSIDSKDTITNNGSIDGLIDLGAGNDKFINNNQLIDDVFMGAGNDSFVNKGTHNGSVYLGSGNDKFTGGNVNEKVYDEAGKDSYKLGGGDDSFYALVFANNKDTSDGFTDTIDGGAGLRDIYEANGASESVVVNLGSVKYTDILSGVIAAKNLAIGVNTGKDVLKNIEGASGGFGDDLLIGSKLANVLLGNHGNDTIYGGAGNDSIDGGAGDDAIFGDAGADVIFAGYANGVDVIYYRSLSDSTAAAGGRDVIYLFGDGAGLGEDIIDFSFLNLNNASFIGSDLFTPIAGEAEIRVADITVGQWAIMLDANGDGIIDLQISVSTADTVINWDASDFRLV